MVRLCVGDRQGGSPSALCSSHCHQNKPVQAGATVAWWLLLPPFLRRSTADRLYAKTDATVTKAMGADDSFKDSDGLTAVKTFKEA